MLYLPFLAMMAAPLVLAFTDSYNDLVDREMQEVDLYDGDLFERDVFEDSHEELEFLLEERDFPSDNTDENYLARRAETPGFRQELAALTREYKEGENAYFDLARKLNVTRDSAKLAQDDLSKLSKAARRVAQYRRKAMKLCSEAGLDPGGHEHEMLKWTGLADKWAGQRKALERSSKTDAGAGSKAKKVH